MGEHHWRDRLKYRFDGWMSKGTGAIIGLLGAATLTIAVLFGLFTWIVLFIFPDAASPDAREDPWEIFWTALLTSVEPAAVDSVRGWFFRIAMLVVAVLGIVIFAGLVGVVSGAFDQRIELLRKGKSRVLESDHTIILGWNEKVPTLIAELAVANESRGRAVIAILAPKDQVEMNDFIRAAVPNRISTQVICRTGDPKLVRDLDIVRPQTARSLILLSPEGVDDPDHELIKTALALNDLLPKIGETAFVVGELKDEANRQVAALAGSESFHWVCGREFIGRLIVQCCRQPGLAAVYQELLSFVGSEFYFTREPKLVGETYVNAQLSYPDTVVVGIATDAEIILNPPAETRIGADDQLIVIAEDDSTIRLGTLTPRPPLPLPEALPNAPTPDEIVILGSNAALASILRELDAHATPNSRVQIISLSAGELPQLKALKVTQTIADPTRTSVIQKLDLSAIDQIVVLPELDTFDWRAADDRTLVTLLQLRHLEERQQCSVGIVSEMLDDLNRVLAQVSRAEDFVISEKIVALALTQVSEEARVMQLFDILFSRGGMRLGLYPVENYLQLADEVDFYTVTQLASQLGETAIGYRLAADSDNPAADYGLHLNPRKAEPLRFSPGDKIVVIGDQ